MSDTPVARQLPILLPPPPVQQSQADEADTVYAAAVLMEDVDVMCAAVRVRWAYATQRAGDPADLELVAAFGECVRDMAEFGDDTLPSPGAPLLLEHDV